MGNTVPCCGGVVMQYNKKEEYIRTYQETHPRQSKKERMKGGDKLKNDRSYHYRCV